MSALLLLLLLVGSPGAQAREVLVGPDFSGGNDASDRGLRQGREAQF